MTSWSAPKPQDATADEIVASHASGSRDPEPAPGPSSRLTGSLQQALIPRNAMPLRSGAASLYAPAVTFTTRDGHLVASSSTLEVVFDGETGGVLVLRNVVTGRSFLQEAHTPPKPWTLMPQGSGATASIRFGGQPPNVFVDEISPAAFRFEIDGDEANLHWDTDVPGIGVGVRAVLEGDHLELWPSVSVADGVRPPECLTYPLLLNLEALGDDRLLFPVHSGWLYRAPFERPHESAYPDGYLGCSVQCMAWFADDSDGLYIAAHDPHSTHKSFRFTAAQTHVRHDAWDLRPGASMHLDYPVVIAALKRGDWYEAAERYRAWAIAGAPWIRKPNAERNDDDVARWLFEETGVSLWCGPSAVDWSPWYRAYADAFNTPIHVVAGWEWPATRPHNVGKEGWFPARIHPANREAWKGHRVTPYMNDLFVAPAAENFATEWEPNLILPYRTFTFTVFSEPHPDWLTGEADPPDPDVSTAITFYACPATEKHQDLHTWRDLKLVRDEGMDGIFYDISSGNPPLRCLRASHGHAPGWGREIMHAYDRQNRLSKEAILRETGRYAAQGTEVIIENVIGAIDFYVSRACAGPVAGLEAFVGGPETPPGGKVELVPLFQAIYHDVGPVHEDGWIHPSVEIGDVFYWIAARIALQWGGINSLHYPIEPPEKLPGTPDRSPIVSWDGTTYELDVHQSDPDKLAFLNELAAARTGFGRRYLAYGRLARPAGVSSDSIELTYYRGSEKATAVHRRGTWTVPRVLEGAWRDSDGRIGIFLVNLDGSRLAKTTIDVDASERWSVAPGTAVQRVTTSSITPLHSVGADGRLTLDVELPPRRVVLIEIGT